jgi:hypothetical protein
MERKDQSHVANTKKQKGKIDHRVHIIFFLFWLVLFVKNILTIFQKMQASSISSRAIVEGLITS